MRSPQVIVANILAIYRRELQSYFASPLAYIIAGIVWLLAGFFFVAILLGPEGLIQQSAARDLQGQQLGVPVPPLDVPYEFLRIFLGTMGSLILFILPILSMGLYAEERKRGTLELLATSPLTNWAVALGKLLGVVTFFVTIILPVAVYITWAVSGANPPLSGWILLSGFGGLVVLAAAVLSLGMFISSLTDSTILAAILTFALILFLWIVDVVANAVGGPVGQALAQLSLLSHYDGFIKGTVETRSLWVFASYIFLGIFLTSQSIEAFRFQRS